MSPWVADIHAPASCWNDPGSILSAVGSPRHGSPPSPVNHLLNCAITVKSGRSAQNVTAFYFVEKHQTFIIRNEVCMSNRTEKEMYFNIKPKIRSYHVCVFTHDKLNLVVEPFQ